MGNFQIMALCAVFGGACAFYVSVIGFTISAIAVIGLLLVFNWVAGGVYHAWTIIGAFVAIQVGYFVCLVGLAVTGNMWKVRKQSKRHETDFNIDPD